MADRESLMCPVVRKPFFCSIYHVVFALSYIHVVDEVKTTDSK